MKLDKKNIIGIVAIFVLLIIILVSVIFFTAKKTKKDNYENELKDICKDYYTNIYYSTLENPEEILSIFTDSGLQFDLTILNSYKSFSKDTSAVLSKAKCDYDTSKVAIYPEKPFGKNDFSIEVNLNCEKEVK